MQSSFKLLFLSLSLILLGFTPSDQTKKTFFKGLGNLREVDSGKPLSALAVSADGNVVAGSRSSENVVSGEFIVSEAFIWNNLTDEVTSLTNSKVLLNNLIFDYATALSTKGKIVVGNRAKRRAFIWSQANGMVGLGDLPGGDFESSAAGISADGSTVVGQSSSANGREAFIWSQANGMVGLGDLPGGDFESSAASISADGSTVVGQSSSANGREAFIWSQANGMIGLGDLPGGQFASIAYAVSADGNVVVGRSHTDIGWEAFIWQKEKGMRVLKDLLENEYNLNLTGWILEEALDISADGSTIIGKGYNPERKEEAWIVRLGEF